MSLTGKQVRELQSLYESVYAEKPEKEDVVLTQEEFDELCLVILQEAFESSGVEIFEGRKKLTLIQKGYRHIVKPAIDYIKKNKNFFRHIKSKQNPISKSKTKTQIL